MTLSVNAYGIASSPRKGGALLCLSSRSKKSSPFGRAGASAPERVNDRCFCWFESMAASVKIIPAYQIRQGERFVGAVGVCTPLVLGHGAHHLAGNLADGGAVLRQVGLAAAGVGKQDLTHVAHHQRQRQLLWSIAVVAVALLFGRFVDALGRKAPAQDAAGLFYAK